MREFYTQVYRRNFLWFLLFLVNSGLRGQTPTCGPNQILTSYFSGASSVVGTTGIVGSANSALGVVDGTNVTITNNSGIVLDLGSVVTAGSSLVLAYYSADVNAPMQVLVSSTGAANSFTNIAQI